MIGLLKLYLCCLNLFLKKLSGSLLCHTYNMIQEFFKYTDAALLGQPRTIGWIEDLSIFQKLVSLSLSDNCLEQFPSSLCKISGLRELDLSCNAIKTIPQEINCLTE